ncbi:MAG: helix-turn-helix domain-containing protein [Muribaculaceae bacterium]|nr:helix-turn-helix domain-containing protein [Muribaculaceae bacterium]
MSSTIEFQKVCEFCGASFTARKSSTRYCSKRCSEHAYKQRKREEHVASTQKTFDAKTTEAEETLSFLSPRQCARLIGVSTRTLYRYLERGSIPCVQFSGKTFISRAVLDEMFKSSSPYIKRETKASEPITEFYTSKEVLEKFGIGNSWLYKMASKHNIPKTVSRGKTLWSKKHIDRIFGKPVEEVVNKDEWYTVDEVCIKFGMKKEALYRLVSESKITKQKVRNIVYYFRQEVDAAMGINPELANEYYSIQEAMGAYGMTRDQISYYVRTYKVPRIYRDNRVYIERAGLDKVLGIPKIE